MKKLFIIIGICMLFNSCTNSRGAYILLQKEGYTNIRLTGYKFFECGKDDSLHTGFIAEKKRAGN